MDLDTQPDSHHCGGIAHRCGVTESGRRSRADESRVFKSLDLESTTSAENWNLARIRAGEMMMKLRAT
ncbi:MAG: hypothetical protein R2861_10775 [Desulfobacterales bacterium]